MIDLGKIKLSTIHGEFESDVIKETITVGGFSSSFSVCIAVYGQKVTASFTDFFPPIPETFEKILNKTLAENYLLIDTIKGKFLAELFSDHSTGKFLAILFVDGRKLTAIADSDKPEAFSEAINKLLQDKQQ